ncbi:hypothetical protein MTO96_049629 [Rhipicephalus appendiculatus]
MIRDQDPIVVVQCLHALDEILRAEGGIAINKKISAYLLKQLPLFSNWDAIAVFGYLKKYQPKTEEEALMFVNALDPYLTSNSIAVQLSAFELFVHATHSLSHLQIEGITQSSNGSEKYAQVYPSIFRPHSAKFFRVVLGSPSAEGEEDEDTEVPGAREQPA